MLVRTARGTEPMSATETKFATMVASRLWDDVEHFVLAPSTNAWPPLVGALDASF